MGDRTRTPVAPLPTEVDLEAGVPPSAEHELEQYSSPARYSQMERNAGDEDLGEKPPVEARFSGETAGGGDDVAASDDPQQEQEQQEQQRHRTSERLEPSQKWTKHQLFYVFGLDGLGSMVLSAGVNFAIAYAMYSRQDPKTKPIRLWELPNTLAGDAAVTMFVQCILTWFIEWGLVAYDLSKRGVQPIGFFRQPSHPVLRWFFFLPPSLRRPSSSHTAAVPSQPAWLWRPMSSAGKGKSVDANVGVAVHQALRGFLVAVVFGGLLVWPVGVAALTGFGEGVGGAERVYHTKWTPQVFKAVLGGTLGLLTTPLMALFWLVKAGWEVQE